MSNLDWGWKWLEVFEGLVWKVARRGFVLHFDSLTSLPIERPVQVISLPDRVQLTFLTPKTIEQLLAKERAKKPGQERVTRSEMEGRHEKYAMCTAWQFARQGKLGKRDSVTLSARDLIDAVPHDLMLMGSGHRLGVEFRFLPLDEAQRHRKRDLEHEGGTMILENLQ